MLNENILEFEKKHSKNLTELNEWLEKIRYSQIKEKSEEDIEGYHTQATKDEVDMFLRSKEKLKGDPHIRQLEVCFIEESVLYKECGKLWDSDPLYKKINESQLEDIAHLKVITGYLTDQELKERLIYENYMLLKTEDIIDWYLTHQKERQLRAEIEKKRIELKNLENKLTKPTLEDKVDKVVYDLTRKNI